MPLSLRNKNTDISNNRKKVGKSVNKEDEILNNKKRMATSPAKGDIVKRSAFGDITNAITIPSKDEKINTKKIAVRNTQKQKKQVELSQNDDSFDMLSKTTSQISLSSAKKNKSHISSVSKLSTKNLAEEELSTNFYEHEASPERKALSYTDIDLDNLDNPNETPVYGFVIFEYMRAREKQFPLTKYMSKQKEITPDMRAILVDWMVEVQENFELNHETLYLAVKLTDHYLSLTQSTREILQLIGASSLLIAAKFDERHPPYIDDFLYICDDAYNRKEMLSMERLLLQKIGFDINIPISYRFLRRYAKCSKTNMETLTLARFALELSLQHYEFVGESESMLAAGALWLAFKMKSSGEWTDTLRYYTSHKEWDVAIMACKLNKMIEASKGKKLQTVWQKYSHSIFYEVAKIPTLTGEKIDKELGRISKLEEKQDT